MSSFTFQVEQYSDVIEEMKGLYQEHWEEIALDKDVIKLNMDYETYDQMAQAGKIHVVTARADGKLIGYHMSMVSGHLHYKQSLTAFTDIFFLKKEFRKGTGAGYAMLKLMVSSLRERGVQKIYMGTKLHMDIGPLLERLKFKPIERLYTLVLE